MAREVLVVEDEPDIRRPIVLHLDREGFRCRTAPSGSDALAKVKAAVPDLVVPDVILPASHGSRGGPHLRDDRGTTARTRGTSSLRENGLAT